ncbi:hypothetical protein BDR07DRAFT_1460432 [Suillus spraguei]|nr:hypothetical protein BDR07DRAFT_1460432 [Suillus spraguei]
MAFATITTLIYFITPPDGSRPYYRVYDDTTGKPSRNWIEEPHEMQIEDVRGKEELYKLDNAGFQYGREAPKHTSFLNDDEIKREYYPESIDLIKRVTGATQVVIFDHTIRRRVPGLDDNPQNVNQQPRHFPPTEAFALMRRRFQIINLWRPISHPAEDWPLALCDFRSVDFEKELVPVALVFPIGRGLSFDSIQDGSVARLTPHTAFQDPNTPEGAPLRESIELRTLVFYD